MKRYFFFLTFFVILTLLGMAQFAAATDEPPPPPPPAPTAIVLDTRGEMLTGVSRLMEYSTNGTRWIAITGNTLNISNLIPSAAANNDATIRVRLRAVGATPASLEAAPIRLPKRPQTPTAEAVGFDGFTETISVTDLMETRLGASGNFTPVPSGATSIPAPATTSAKTYQVRVKATDTMFASAARSVSVRARAAAPNAVYNSITDLITGVSKSMEFRIGSGEGVATWTSITGASIPRSEFGDIATTVFVRTKATASAPYSIEKKVSVPGVPGPPPTGFVLNTYTETLSGVSRMEYSANGTRWTAVAGDSLDISNLISFSPTSDEVTLLFRIRATSATAASEVARVVIPRRPAAPPANEIKFDGLSETITAGSSTEFRIGSSGRFTPVPADGIIRDVVGSSTQSYVVRYKATDDKFASAVRSITVRSRGAAPNPVYNGSTDTITGVSKSMEYRVAGETSWTPVTNTSITRSVFGDTATTVSIRISGTAAVPASKAREVRVPPRGSAAASPTSFTLDMRKETLNVGSRGMEYSTNGSRWTAIPGNTLSLTNLIPSATARGDLTILVRAKATSTAAASDPTTVVIPKRPEAPPASVVKFDGITETISIADNMEFRQSTRVAFTPAPGDGKVSSVVGASARVYHVRYKATDDAFASAIRNVSVQPRRPAPNAAYHRPTDRIMNVSLTMEYSLDDGASWDTIDSIPPPNGFIPRVVFGKDAGVILIRHGATVSLPASNIKKVYFPAYIPPPEPDIKDPAP